MSREYRSAVRKIARDVSANALEGSLRDFDHRGAIGEADFQEVLSDLHLDLSRAEMSEVVRELSVDRKGNIDYKELCNDVRKERDDSSVDSGRRRRKGSGSGSDDGRRRKGDSGHRKDDSGRRRRKGSNEGASIEAGDKLKRFLERDNRDDEGKSVAEKLLDEFERIDEDLNNQITGKVSHRDFSDAFDWVRLSFSEKQLHTLLREYPKDSRGCANYKDVLKDHGYDADQIVAKKKLMRELKKEKRDENGRNGLERVKLAMESIDKDVNENPLGMLTVREMSEALTKVGMTFKESEMKALLRGHHQDSAGRVNYVDVLRQLSGKKTLQLSLEKGKKGSSFMDEKSWSKKNGSVGEWLMQKATPMERKNFHELMTLLNKFEQDHGLQQTDGTASGQHIVLPLGPDLKVAMRFFT
jgi:Ca2+-binding EF-hand superfamily protein